MRVKEHARKIIVGTTVGTAALLSFYSSPANTAVTCETVSWGSLGRGDSAVVGDSTISNVRSGQHDCFDRIVIDLNGQAPKYSVSYSEEIIGDTTGELVELEGNAALDVRIAGTTYDIETGESTYEPENRQSIVDLNGYEALRQVALASSSEGQTQIGIGTRGRLPFRAFTLQDTETSKLVIDVAHNW